MNFHLLTKVIEELSALLTGARVERVIQGRDGGLYLLFRCDRKNYVLLLSPDRACPRMHLASAKPQAIDAPHLFVLTLRSRLAGSRVKNISLLNQDRIARICFDTPSTEQCLVFELTGSSANLFLIGSDSRIIAAYHPVIPAGHAARILLPGALYLPPQKKTSLSTDKNVSGGDDDLTPNKSAEAYYERLAAERSLAALRSEVRSCIRKALLKAVRKRDALASDLQSAERADEFKQAGDLILAHLRQLKTGMDHAELTGYDGGSVTVRLDPKRSPSRNAELNFKKFKKAKAGQQIITTHLRDAAEEVSSLQSLLQAAEKTEDASGLNEIRSGLSARGYARGVVPEKTKAPSAKRVSGFRTVVHRGWEILIGTNASGNDKLTTKIARPEDLWLHAESLPGSHVLVRNAKREEIPQDVLMKAAALAAYYSKGRNADKVPVTYTYARFVKKPKGAKPGLVTISERRTIMIRPEDTALV